MTNISYNPSHSLDLASLKGKPAFYAWTTPTEQEIVWHQRNPNDGKGRIKCGQRADGDVEARINDTNRTGNSEKRHILLWADTFPLKDTKDESKGYKTDDDWKGFVSKHQGFEQAWLRLSKGEKSGDEWYELTEKEIKGLWIEFKEGIPYEKGRTKNYSPRPEQNQAIEDAYNWYMAHATAAFTEEKCFLWNAKMRFGKCFTTYKLLQKLKPEGGARAVIITHKPTAFESWKEDAVEHVDFTGWKIITATTSEEDKEKWLASNDNIVALVSFQDLNSNKKEIKERNKYLYETIWDLCALDEYHFGAWNSTSKQHLAGWAGIMGDDDILSNDSEEETNDTELKELVESVEEIDSDNTYHAVKPDDLKQRGIQSDFYLYLSGTPFRAIESEELQPEQIFTWTYADEQKAKRAWQKELDEGLRTDRNIYSELPKLMMLTYNVPNEAKELAQDKDGWFNLNAFFACKKDSEGSYLKDEEGNYIFVHANMVFRFLDYLTGEASLKIEGAGDDAPDLPFKEAKMIRELAHTFWLLPNVSSVFAMKSLMATHPFFKNYKVLAMAGSGVSADEATTIVKTAIQKAENNRDRGTITLSCGKLATGSTVKEWAGVFMLANTKTPETYMQTCFRAGTPWTTVDPETKELFIKKERFWVFDFAPQRTLKKVYELAKLQTPNKSSLGNLVVNNDIDTVNEWLGLMSVYCYDGGTMSELDAEEVLTVIDRGITQNMLVRKWRSKRLINLNLQQLIKIKDTSPEVIEIIDKIVQHRRGKGSLNTESVFERVINSEKDIRDKKEKKQKPTTAESKENKEAKTELSKIKEKLEVFIQRIPLFMYITDERERNLLEVIATTEGHLFEKSTGLTVQEFSRLNEIGVFPANTMNELIWRFKNFEDGSYDHLGSTDQPKTNELVGWDAKIHVDDFTESTRLG